MKDYTRRSVAFAVGNYFNKNHSSIYDYQQNGYFNFSGGDSIYDFNEKCHINCNITGNDIQLYHYKNQKYINLNIEKDGFTGYDFDTQNHYSGNISGNQITIYDYEYNKYFNYLVS